MQYIVLRGIVTPDRKLEVELPDDMPTGSVGTWAARTNIGDSVEFACELRKRAFPKE